MVCFSHTLFVSIHFHSQMHPMNQMANTNMGMNTMNAIAQLNQMNEMQQTNNPMAKMQGMANGYAKIVLFLIVCSLIDFEANSITAQCIGIQRGGCHLIQHHKCMPHKSVACIQ